MSYKKTFSFNSEWLKVPVAELENSLIKGLSTEDGFISLKCWTQADKFVPHLAPDLLVEVETEKVEDMVLLAVEMTLIISDYVDDWMDFDHTTAGYDAAQRDREKFGD